MTIIVEKRNKFVALCENASQNEWCWKIFCGTCGHTDFKVAFSKLVHGLHPDDDDFWPNGKEQSKLYQEKNSYRDFERRATIDNQRKLATIVSESKIVDIQAVTRFPDWLGYLGFVIHHCPVTSARKILSDSLLPQFISLIAHDRELHDHLKHKQSVQQLLDLEDLNMMEHGI